MKNLKVYFKDLKEKKNIPTNDYLFTTAIDNKRNNLPLFTMHFEQPLAVFLFEKLKELPVSLTGRFIRPEFFAKKIHSWQNVKAWFD